MEPKQIKNHAFYATRKGTPKGVKGDWANRCDVCDLGLRDPIHVVSQAEADQNVLDAIEGRRDDGKQHE